MNSLERDKMEKMHVNWVRIDIMGFMYVNYVFYAKVQIALAKIVHRISNLTDSPNSASAQQTFTISLQDIKRWQL